MGDRSLVLVLDAGFSLSPGEALNKLLSTCCTAAPVITSPVSLGPQSSLLYGAGAQQVEFPKLMHLKPSSTESDLVDLV